MDKYCKFCGVDHTMTTYPKTCMTCGTTTYINPTPVAVMLLPVEAAGGRIGLLVGKRAIEPSKGLYGLPGGFMETTDASFEAAALRELREETGVDYKGPVSLRHSMCDGRNTLVFVGADEPIRSFEITLQFRASEECPEAKAIFEPEELAFPSHTEAARRFFQSRLTPSSSTKSGSARS